MNSPIASVTVTLNEPAGSGFFGTGALTLTDNGGPNLITSPVSITLVSGSTYSITRPLNPDDRGGILHPDRDAAHILDPDGNTGTGSKSISWLMDTTPPTSSVSVLPIAITSTSPSFSVTWSGSDNPGGSGIAGYDVYVSTDGGAFVPFMTDTVQTSSVFSGSFGHSYGFYSVAIDGAGNRQPAPTSAQAATFLIIEPSLGIDSPQPVVERNGASLVFTVRLTAPITQAVTVSYATANGTAFANKNYRSTKGTLTFGPGKPLVQTIKVPVLDDRRYGDNVSLGVNLSLKQGNIPITQGSASGTILEGDPVPKLSIGDVIIRQGPSGTSKATFAVTLKGTTVKATTVSYATADGTASVADHDYQAAAGMLSFAPGVTKKTITVLVNADPTSEPPETFHVRLSNPIGATLSRTAGMGTIINTSPKQKAKKQGVVTLRRSERILPLIQRQTGGDLVGAAIQSLMGS